MNLSNIKLTIFDLDGTLTRSKCKMDDEMKSLILSLLRNYKVAIISGSKYEEVKKRFIDVLSDESVNENLYIMPTNGTILCHYENGNIKQFYEDAMTQSERKKIIEAVDIAIKETNYNKFINKVFGKQIEDRRTQITFSALGQEAPIEIKKSWDEDYKKRSILKKKLDELLPEYEIRYGGTTSIDITRKGRDKSYGINQITSFLNIPKKQSLFVGDSMHDYGNDFPATKTGVLVKETHSVEETKRIIKDLLQNNLSN